MKRKALFIGGTGTISTAITLYIMELMDGLRKDWDVRYPMDEIDWK